MQGLSVWMYLKSDVAEAYEAKHGHKLDRNNGVPYMPVIGCWPPELLVEYGSVVFSIKAKVLPCDKPCPAELDFDNGVKAVSKVTRDGFITYGMVCDNLMAAFFCLGWIEERYHRRGVMIDPRGFQQPLFYAEVLGPDDRYEDHWVDVGGESGVLDCIALEEGSYTPVLNLRGCQLVDQLCSPPLALGGSQLTTFGLYEGSGGPSHLARWYGEDGKHVAVFERSGNVRRRVSHISAPDRGARVKIFQEGLGLMMMILGAKAARES